MGGESPWKNVRKREITGSRRCAGGDGQRGCRPRTKVNGQKQTTRASPLWAAVVFGDGKATAAWSVVPLERLD